MIYPKKLFYNYSPVCKFPHAVGIERYGGSKMLFSMNYRNNYDKLVAKEIVRRWNLVESLKEEVYPKEMNEECIPISPKEEE